MTADDRTEIERKIDQANQAIDDAKLAKANAGHLLTHRQRQLQDLVAALKLLHPEEAASILG
jgi:F0F1-type ATP synthase membrane subunit b/b'